MKPPHELKFNMKLTVSEDTAKACLRMVQIYCNDTGLRVVGRKRPDGAVDFAFEEGPLDLGAALDAMRTVQNECVHHCNGCRLQPWCKCEAPEGWKLPE